VILFDEIEKAHADVFNVLLQVLDDGRLTDGQGRTVDFKNTIIVMTSNLGSQIIQELTGENAEPWEIEARVNDILKQAFRPEFLNRVDETITFSNLSKENLKAIVDIQVRELSRRLADQRLTLELTEPAKELACEMGWDPTFGARPLKRFLQRSLENSLARKILEGEIAEGDHVRVDAAGRSFTFEVAQHAEYASDGGEVIEGELIEDNPPQ
jgi:ATP-dependent Clp protease ATP-binding subunit ClpB